MRNMNLTPRPRDLTALLDRYRKTGIGGYRKTGIGGYRDTEKPEGRETERRGGLGEDQREPSRLDPTPAQGLGRRA